MNRNFLLLVITGFFFPVNLFSQVRETDSVKKPQAPLRKYYTGNAFETATLSTAMINKDANGVATRSNGTIRFTALTNIGLTFNSNIDENFGAYTGIILKNIGYIQNTNGYTYKRRVYTIGAPFGIKVGKLSVPEWYFFMGGGVDVPFNYREKQYQVVTEKSKFNEWFSNRTPHFLPYVFAGFSPNIWWPTFKIQYYPGNFLNPDYSKNGVNPLCR